LGTQRLPDLAAGAIARAVAAGKQKDFPRAPGTWATAERCDPGRAEPAFAESTVDRLQGDFLGAAAARLRAYPRIFNHPLESYLWLQDLLFWALVLLLSGGVRCSAGREGAKGRPLVRARFYLSGRPLPRPV